MSYIALSVSLEYLCFPVGGIDIRRQILTSIDVRIWRIKSDPALKGLKQYIKKITHLKLYLATASHNLKWVKITHICLIWDPTFWKSSSLNTNFIPNKSYLSS